MGRSRIVNVSATLTDRFALLGGKSNDMFEHVKGQAMQSPISHHFIDEAGGLKGVREYAHKGRL